MKKKNIFGSKEMKNVVFSPAAILRIRLIRVTYLFADCVVVVAVAVEKRFISLHENDSMFRSRGPEYDFFLRRFDISTRI